MYTQPETRNTYTRDKEHVHQRQGTRTPEARNTYTRDKEHVHQRQGTRTLLSVKISPQMTKKEYEFTVDAPFRKT